MSRKLPTLGVTSRPSAPISRGQPGQPVLVVRDGAARYARSSASAATPAASAGAVDVERPADAVQRIGDMRPGA